MSVSDENPYPRPRRNDLIWTWFSMTPLWTRAIFPSLLTWGWAFASVTPPWVAQRVCPTPTVPDRLSRPASCARFSTRPVRRTTEIPPSCITASPAES